MSWLETLLNEDNDNCLTSGRIISLKIEFPGKKKKHVLLSRRTFTSF